MYNKIAKAIEDSLDGFKIYYNNNMSEFEEHLPNGLIEGVITFIDRPQRDIDVVKGNLYFTINFAFPIDKKEYNEAIAKLTNFAQSYRNTNFDIPGLGMEAQLFCEGPTSQGIVMQTSAGEKVSVMLTGQILYFTKLLMMEEVSVILSNSPIQSTDSCFKGMIEHVYTNSVTHEPDVTCELTKAIPIGFSKALSIKYTEFADDQMHKAITARALSCAYNGTNYNPKTPVYVKYIENGMFTTFKGSIQSNTIIGQIGYWIQREIKIVECD